MASKVELSVAQSALAQLLAAGGISGEAGFDDVDVSLQTRFRIAEGASAALAAGGIAAESIGRMRGQPASSVTVNPRHAEQSLRSYDHVGFADPEQAGDAAKVRERMVDPGYYPTADGRWFFLHPAFPHNTHGLMELLGVDDAEDLPAAVGTRNGLELETACAERGLCSALARPPEEWDDSEPGHVLNTRPVVDIVQIGDTEPMPLPNGGDRPLDGVNVLDLTRILAGPTCARTLASYGAKATRIGAEHLPSIPLFVVDTGFGKTSRFLDLKANADADQLRSMLADADVFSQGYRTGAMDRLGFGAAQVAAMKPGIVYVSINCYGHEGGWRSKPGWEQLAQTVTGMSTVHGDHQNDGVPQLQPAAVTDYGTGYLAAYGAMVALARRATYGGSYWVRVSLSRTGVWYRSLGLRPEADARATTAEEITAMSATTETAWGNVNALTPVVRFSNANIRWDQPPGPSRHRRLTAQSRRCERQRATR